MDKSRLVVEQSGDFKAITTIPGWKDRLDASDKITSVEAGYAAIPTLYRAIQLRCDALSSVPMHILNRRGNDVGWPYPEALDDLIWRTEAALLMTGAAYWLILRNDVRVVGVQNLNPLSINIGVNGDTGELVFSQQVGGKKFGPWTEDEIIYFREYDPAQDLGPGVAAAKVALTDAQLLHYMPRFASVFFESGAMPAVILGLEGNVTSDERERIEGVIKRMITGIRKAFSVVAIRAGIKPAILTPPIKDLVMKDLEELARRNVSRALGVPVSMLEDSANFATAKEHRMSFWEDTVRPRKRLYTGPINRLLAPLGLRFEMAFEELSIFQVDEAERSAALADLVASGVPLEMALDMLGYSLSDQQRAMLPSATPATPDEPVRATRESDLAKWERKALKRLKDGKNPSCEFESEHLKQAEIDKIVVELEVCETPEGVRDVFAGID